MFILRAYTGFFFKKERVKKKNPMQYLHYSSCHPSYIKKFIPKSISLCLNQSDFNNFIGKLRTSFVDRCYPPKLVNSQIKGTNNTKYYDY